MVDVRFAIDDDYPKLVDIYKVQYPKHNVLHGPEAVDYLKGKDEENRKHGGGLLVAYDNGQVLGSILVRFLRQTPDSSHSNWRYNHIAVDPDHTGKGIGKKLIRHADEMIRSKLEDGKFSTAKIELNVSEFQEKSIGFYERCGFEVEGKLKSQYRWGEASYILGKEMDLRKG